MSGPKDEEGELVAFEGSLSESRERSGTTWAGDAGGDATGAIGAVDAREGGAVCATCNGMAKYGIEGSKAG